MKKKQYFKPETLMFKVELQQIIALSTLGDATNNEVLSRGDDFFEDEEDYVTPQHTTTVWDDDRNHDDRGGW